MCQREALRLDPDSADAQNNLGMAHYALGHIAEAENCFRAALRLRPDYANATLNLGSTRQILDHVEEAEALFRHALARASTLPRQEQPVPGPDRTGSAGSGGVLPSRNPGTASRLRGG